MVNINDKSNYQLSSMTPELPHISAILVLLENVTTHLLLSNMPGANTYNRYGLLILVTSSPADYNDDHLIQYFMVQYDMYQQ